MPLTHLQCESAKPETKPYKLADQHGLYLNVMPSGRRYWRYRYSMNGKQRTLTIGEFPQIPLATARDTLADAKAKIAQNIDPVLKQKEQKQLAKYNAALNFKAIAVEWHELNKDTWTERHANYVLRRLELHVFDEIGEYPLDQLTPALMMACLQKVEKTGPEMARRVMSMCSRIFQYAIATGRGERDYTIGLKYGLKKYKPKHYAAVSLDELPELVRKIHFNGARLYKQTHLCLKLMLLTAVRTCELIEARWSEFDLENQMWVIPAERMKTRRLHKVPLSRQALAILQELKAMNGKRDFVFPSIPRPRKPMSNATLLKALAALDYKYKMTGHGFRSVLMGVCKQHLGYRHEPVDRQLAHVPRSSVDRAYDRADYLPERVVMMQQYADYIDKILYEPAKETHSEPATKPKFTASFQIGGHLAAIEYKAVNIREADSARVVPEGSKRRGRPAEILDSRTIETVH